MFLLDTDVVVELRLSGSAQAHPAVVAWAASQPPSALFLSAITVMELETRVLSIMRQDGGKGAALKSWLNDQVLKAFAGRILPVDTTVAQRCARLQVTHPRPDRDALIAATALVHGMTVVTGNTGVFAGSGVVTQDPRLASPVG